jgi:hypothetical protein
VGPVWPICAANSELLFAVAVDQLCAARLLRPQDLKTRMAAFGSNTVCSSTECDLCRHRRMEMGLLAHNPSQSAAWLKPACDWATFGKVGGSRQSTVEIALRWPENRAY